MSDITLKSYLKESCESQPNGNAIEVDGKWYPWKLIGDTIDGLGSIFSSKSVPRGAQVALLCRNRAHQVAAFCSVIANECCVTPINPFGSGDKIISELKDIESTIVIASAEDWEIPNLKQYALNNNILAICLDETVNENSVSVLNPDIELNSKLSTNAKPGIAVLIQSSGTTGKPKRIPIGEKNLTAAYSKLPYSAKTGAAATVQKKPALITQPLVHIGGLFWIIHSLLEMRPVILFERFNAKVWAKLVDKHNIRVCSLVPAMINMVLESDIKKEELDSLICIRSGTAALSTDAQKEFENRFGVPILTVYGATEFAGAVCGWTLDLKKEFGDAKIGSVGTAFKGVKLRIVDRETLEPVEIGDTGLLQVQSNQISGNSDWIPTTDLAQIDKDGFVWLKGRADSAINRGGFKIIPSEVVSILEKHDAVNEAMVLGLDDKRLGQVPVALVQLNEGATSINGDKLKEWARDNMTRYFVPVTIKVVAELPRTPSMKLSQFEARKLFEV